MDYTFQDFKEYISYLKTLSKEEMANIQTIVIDTDPIPFHIANKERKDFPMKTVKELRDYLANLPDDMIIVHFIEDMERSGYMPNIYPRVANMSPIKEQTYDSFDGTAYDYTHYIYDEEGTPVLALN